MDTSRRVVASRRFDSFSPEEDGPRIDLWAPLDLLEGKRARNKRIERGLSLERERGRRREGGCEGKNAAEGGGAFRVLINCFYHRLLCPNLLSSISPPLLRPPLVFYRTLALLPFFCLRARSMGVYRYGRARGRNSFRRNEVMKSDLTSLTGLIGLIWRSLYTSINCKGVWRSPTFALAVFAPMVQFIVPSAL